MQANEQLLEIWIQALCAELGELSGGVIAASTAAHDGNRAPAYGTTLLAEGPVHGELYIAVLAGELVQFTQLASGEPLDPDVACDPERIEAWRRLLASTSGRVSATLNAEFTDPTSGRCVLLLADTSPVENDEPWSGEPGSRIERWLLQAGQSRLAVLARARIESPRELVAWPPATSSAPLASSIESQAQAANQAQPVASGPTGNNEPEHSANAIPAEPHNPEKPHERAPKHRHAFDGIDASSPSFEQTRRLDLLLDIELEATLRFGAIEMPLREVLELGPGDVLSLDRHVQEPVELVVGDRIVARGEVVLIGGNFGLQVTEVAEPRRRLETIRCLF